MFSKHLIFFMLLITGFSFSGLKAQTDGGTFTDNRDGSVYQTVTIGKQVWMAENLRYLPQVNDSRTGSQSVPYFYVYGYNGTSVESAERSKYYSVYGVLYNWPAAMAGSPGINSNPVGVQGVCPDGWHLPSDAEWTELMNYLGDEGYAGRECTVLKAREGWVNDGNGTDNYGFSALPGGGRYSLINNYDGLGQSGRFWSSTEASDTTAWYRSFGYPNSAVYRMDTDKELGFSIRCIRD
jgi:uncharacterized protein (TIGR02145 family)